MTTTMTTATKVSVWFVVGTAIVALILGLFGFIAYFFS